MVKANIVLTCLIAVMSLGAANTSPSARAPRDSFPSVTPP